ncbi:Retrovirus-related Pol polyprotein from transposon TNT 1-94 [Melia azedarach]|uniref:Retrovirus-related Pol polyprotein from transposon TNT 1-94 n=1 Tax=Melia azedarach TaxID=155640 RepID=A0ACC1YI15_MELAZ|nr:Retrovirus-related Pol polyprotein from transposon TNT 1-94 [Melia azedarach]
MTCPTDIEKQRRRTAEERVYIFLAGLGHNLDQVSDRVLATSPLPSLEEACSQVRHEAQRQTTMSAEDKSEASAMPVNKPTPIVDTLNRFCTHYNSTKHTVYVCWKKNGHPEWYKLKQADQRNKKSTQVAVRSTNPTASASLVSHSSTQEGDSSLCLISAAFNTWVIDSGATDHMNSNLSLLDSLMTSNVKSVQVANRTPMPISEAGNVSFSSTFPMSYVLLAPHLSNNFFPLARLLKLLIVL